MQPLREDVGPLVAYEVEVALVFKSQLAGPLSQYFLHEAVFVCGQRLVGVALHEPFQPHARPDLVYVFYGTGEVVVGLQQSFGVSEV